MSLLWCVEGWLNFLQAAMGIRLKVLDPNENCPAASVAEQVQGDFSDFDTIKYVCIGYVFSAEASDLGIERRHA